MTSSQAKLIGSGRLVSAAKVGAQAVICLESGDRITAHYHDGRSVTEKSVVHYGQSYVVLPGGGSIKRVDGGLLYDG